MKKFSKGFLVGASTAAHQVEGNNTHSDFWAMEQMPHTRFSEPSLDAVDHYNRFEEDIQTLAQAGLNAYRFSIEWARIEPEKGVYDDSEVEHYRRVLECCHANGVTPVVTMHHFTTPVWAIRDGGWENEEIAEHFANYCRYTVQRLGDLMEYVCTINEANMGLQLAAIIRDMMKQLMANAQVGVDMEAMMAQHAQSPEALECREVFGTDNPQGFLSVRTPAGDAIIMKAHTQAKRAMKEVCPHLKVGVTLSLFDIQVEEGGEELAQQMWEEEFRHYIPFIKDDDFFGLQNYTRKRITSDGALPVPPGVETTQMDYEFYPQALGHVIRRVYGELGLPIMVTENGVATTDDTRRVAFIDQALAGVQECMEEGIPVLGYMHWSLMDNFEWQKGFSMNFGLIAVDRGTQQRLPKPSLAHLGSYRA